MADSGEKELVDKARSGDRKAFGALVRSHHRRVWSLAAHMLGNRAEADDVVQEAFLRALRAMDRFDGRSEFGTWIYRIVVNLSLNAIRGRKRTSAVAPDDPRLTRVASADPARGAEHRGAYERLAAAVDALSPTLRTTLVLVTLQGVGHREAGEILGCSEGTIAWRVHEARRRLREALGDEAPAKADAPRAAAPKSEAKSPAEVPTPRKDDTDEGWD
jgi:RNA polymerase sigma-70 factor (ECF subfamily)